MEETSPLTFRITFWRPWLLALTPLVLLAVLAIVPAVSAGEPGSVLVVILGFMGFALVLLVLVSSAVWVSRWHIDPQGIGGRNNWLIYHRLDWAEIDSVEPWLIPGYPYLQVNGLGRYRTFWLPLFLTDMPGLRAAVIQYAPPGNPLRRYLE